MQSKTLEITVDWADIDWFGHVNNVEILRYIQTARVHFWESVGINSAPHVSGYGPVLASVNCNFKHRLHYPGKINIVTQVAFIKNSSFGLKHAILDANHRTCALGEDVIVMFDYLNNIKSEITTEIKANLNHFII